MLHNAWAHIRDYLLANANLKREVSDATNVFDFSASAMSANHSVFLLCDYALQVQKIFQEFV